MRSRTLLVTSFEDIKEDIGEWKRKWKLLHCFHNKQGDQPQAIMLDTALVG